jgi:hypothetical protein
MMDCLATPKRAASWPSESITQIEKSALTCLYCWFGFLILNNL